MNGGIGFKMEKAYTHDFYNILRRYKKRMPRVQAENFAVNEAQGLGVPIYRERKPKQPRFKKQITSSNQFWF